MHLGIDDPPDPALRRHLRAVVLGHGETEHRRVFDPTLHLMALHADPPSGSIDTPAINCVLDREEAWDDALYADVAAALLRRLERAGTGERWLAYLTRTGDPDTQDIDLAVLRSLRTASAEAGPDTADFHFVVVNRKAWCDPATGVGQEWKRLRDRSRGP